jgi:hypothetical protein
MIVIEECAREYFREKYGQELPKDFHGIDYRWSECELEIFEKYLNTGLLKERITAETYDLQQVREIADSPASIEMKLSHGEDIRDLYLLAVYFFRNFSDYVDGWVNTVFKLAIRVNKDNRTNRWPNKDFLYNVLFGKAEDAFSEHLRAFISAFNNKRDPDYTELPIITSYDKNVVFSFCKEYYGWLASELSTKGSMVIEDVRSQISDLLKKYPLL